MALVVGAQLSMFFLVVQYVQRVLGFGPLASGFAFLPLSLGIFAMSRVTPRLVAPVRPRPLMMAGTARPDGQLRLLSRRRRGRRLPRRGLRADAAQRPRRPAWCSCRSPRPCSADVEPEHAGSASGLLQTTQQLGSAVGVAAIVSVYAAGAVPGEFLPGVRAAFLTSAAFAALAFVVADGRPAPAAGGRAGAGGRASRWPEPLPSTAA